MSIGILTDLDAGYQALYCNTTMWAFGGLFELDEDIEDFLEWVPKDPPQM